MSIIRSDRFRATEDACETKLALQDSFRRIQAEQGVSTAVASLTIALIHDVGDNGGMVLAAVTLSGVKLNESHMVRAYQALMRDVPGLTERISTGAFVFHLSLELDLPEHSAP